ncbi:hypothetical protein DLAC_09413 [Tieghemostelium lacteum]|uniref:Transmembrane protein n=1 Tax=Tieghemostelium lacteum TaxID=361077 RepID=A0A151ZA16_TIELA|nr:hypothetical protein DLAC_09413 [Tieghemostelium lacteum]|eukprot:KYQ90773.1 hypothetical protein DLAC_09413 [Tieghemostelium lacteum]
MSRPRNHHHHVHHKRYSCSNCLIGLNICIFISFLIAGSIVMGVSLIPSIQYKDNWVRINCSLTDSTFEQVCQSKKTCQSETNQFQFPYYFTNGQHHTFPYEYDSDDSPIPHSNRTKPLNTCPSSKSTQCFNSTVDFQYPINSSFVATKSLYVFGSYDDANDFDQYFVDPEFHCWMSLLNTNDVSIVPVPKYAPASAITSGVLLTLSLISLLILLILISIRCFCGKSREVSQKYTRIPELQ